ncbi:Uncharacterised protein [Klebsiella pneumoniae]|jgi:hypothetical protein|nr:Uncharacterised protein [Klebsiella pneumoniae]
MLVTTFVCVACFYFELTDIIFLKTKHHFFGMNPIINRDEPCSSNVIVLNNHLALRNLIWNKKYSTFCLWFDLFLF